jgi:phosphoribosylglycinamide formyltransferase-1
LLKNLNIDIIVLAGFLWLVPDTILANYPKRIINIHPALLPKYGGKGMYGDRVHKEVLANGDEESGISIHYVNEDFDTGEIIYQARFKIEKNDDLEIIKFKGQQLEHQYFPKIIEQVLKKIKS